MKSCKKCFISRGIGNEERVSLCLRRVHLLSVQRKTIIALSIPCSHPFDPRALLSPLQQTLRLVSHFLSPRREQVFH